MRHCWHAITMLCLAAVPAAAQQTPPAQPYAGQQDRAVTSLSAADVKDLLAGHGWGLAKPAEFNGYPGPAHVLELAKELQLTESQRSWIEKAFERMQLRAKSIGARYVSAERALDDVFRSGKADAGRLQTRLRDAERLRAELRRVHLAAHLEVTPLLSHEQRKKYAELRGYGAGGNASEQHHRAQH